MGDDLKLKVAVIGFENKSLQGGDEFRQLFLTELPDYLKKDCEFIVIADTESDLQSVQGTSLPRLASGQIDNYALAVFGRQLGLNDFIAGSLIDIRLADEKQGELWFKETFYLIRIVFRVEVFDTYTGTKTLDKIFNREVEIEELEYRLIKESKEIETPKLNETLNHLLTDVADSICLAISDQPWTGYIENVTEDGITVAAGTRAGLETGQKLTVYSSGKVIEGVGGQRFFIPGSKLGKIELVAVAENTADAVLISGEGIKAGSPVKAK